MRSRIVLVALLFPFLAVSLSAQEIMHKNVRDWPARAFQEPPTASAAIESVLTTPVISPFPFIPVTPCRIIDTRLSGGAFSAGETRTYKTSGGSSLACVGAFPVEVGAVSLAITVTQTAGTGFVTGYPTGASLPVAVSMTWIGPDQTLTNAAVVPTGENGSINIYASQATHVILDINGYYGDVGAYENTALGFNAGGSNITTGSANTAIGFTALGSNTTGTLNVAIGDKALSSFSTGFDNTAIGASALSLSSSGSGNIALGASAGGNIKAGSYNIDIGSGPVNDESYTIRVGQSGFHTAAFLGGVSGASSPGGTAVFIDSNGKLGTNTSSRRFKEEIREIATESDGLMKLRPVAFRYKREIDPTRLAQYGLIAEEVADVYPDLVAYDRDGRPETVRYHLLVPMLLNELQKDRNTIKDLKARLERVEAVISESAR